MEIQSAFVTDRGRRRKLNEDAFLANDWLGLYIVCDGMGGHSCGDVASQTVIDVIKAKVEGAKKNGALAKDPPKVFLDAIKLANTAIWELSSKMPQCSTMGTTIAGIMVMDGFFICAHAGDSRIYRIRENSIERLTRDHSLVEEQVSLGLITPKEARSSARKNIITRALGLKEEVKPDSKKHEIKDNDLVLLCSDGLTGMVEDVEMLETLTEEGKNLNKALTDLIELANLNGGDDNITAVAVRFKL